MYVKRKDTGEELFRGPASSAKVFYGSGKRLLDRIVDTTDPGHPVEIQPGVEVELELCYENTAPEKLLYLADTDWYVVREQETGKPMPVDAHAPTDAIILHTLELRHPDFRDDAGNPTAIRVVRDQVDLTARLEADAPLNAGQLVTFICMGFELDLPPVDTAPVPEIVVTLDNVSREIVRHLDAAAESQAVIEITYRPYLSNDLEGPQMDPPITLVLTEVEADVQRVTARARMMDIGNKAFPSRTYTAREFPGLTR